MESQCGFHLVSSLPGEKGKKENKTKSRNCAVGKTHLVLEGASSKEKE